jgi:hypothetical protein
MARATVVHRWSAAAAMPAATAQRTRWVSYIRPLRRPKV